MKYKTVDFKPYSSSLILCDLEWWLSNARRKNLPHGTLEEWVGIGGSFYSLSTEEGHQHFIMVLGEYQEEVLYHECLHACFVMLESAGVIVTAENHEMLTYAQGQMVRDIKRKFYGLKPDRMMTSLTDQYIAQHQEGAQKPVAKACTHKENLTNVRVQRFPTV